MADTFIYRIDHHGSLIRPPALLTARSQHAVGELSAEQLREIEDECITDVVRMQRKLNLTVVTDGHFRREDPFSVYRDAIRGLPGGSADQDDAELTPHRPLLVDDATFVDSLTSMLPAKATMPSPAALVERLAAATGDGSPWQNPRDLGEEIAGIVQDEIEALFARGVRYVQLDHHGYSTYLAGADGASRQQLSLADAAAIDTLAIEGIERPEGAAIGLCPTVELDVEVDEHTAEQLFALPVDRWVLPFHSGAPAELALIRAVPLDRDVCLGVVDAAKPQLEDLDTVLSRLDQIDALRDFERIALSPNRGFSDVAAEPLLGVDDQWKKLVHVETLARMAWGNEL
jgi:5-methyltetrahydropteroyltriglutamate--homocysteine methyltransferase